jgi:UDP-N-acetylglucosamine acyltransferase
MSKPVIHPTAIVGKECELGDGVEIGPYCIVGGRVKLGEGVRLVSHVHISGPVEVGDQTKIYPFTSLGFPPQDVKWKDGNPTAGVKIGRECLLRENVTIHLASKPDRPTTVGDKCFLMVGSHLGHDSRIGNNVVLVNNVLLAGHSEVGDNATLAGAVAMHQFTRIGRLAFVSGMVGVAMDVPPFCVSGKRNMLHGINLIGLRRAGIPRDQITAVRHAFRKALRVSLPRKEMIAILTELGRDCPLVAEMAEFVAAAKRSVATGTRGVQASDTEGLEVG